MRHTLRRFTLVTLASCTAVVLLTGADTRKPATEWLSRPSEAARVARVEAGLAPVLIPGEEPVRMSLQQWMELYKVPGVSIAVFEKHALVWAKGYGVRQAGGQDAVTPDTLFQAASISKPITALATLHHAEARKWSLDAVKILKANVELYPQDSNAHDSLGEGYMEAGQKAEAITSYKKSLELDPKNTNAVKMLEKLGAKP